MSKPFFCFLYLISLFSISCEKDKITNQSIIGKWTWIKTFYGFTNYTETYKNRKYKLEIQFDDYYFYEYIDNSLSQKQQYDLIVKKDGIMYISYENGLEEIISHSKDTLLLYNYQSEGSLSYYIRK
ncbi:MAG TPA: hypothetical protein PK622_04180 [Saprospiraceae bacterium]|jgi:hypothetical protein|nr:hypothetical protein [Saprospiraceae bacterium]